MKYYIAKTISSIADATCLWKQDKKGKVWVVIGHDQEYWNSSHWYKSTANFLDLKQVHHSTARKYFPLAFK